MVPPAQPSSGASLTAGPGAGPSAVAGPPGFTATARDTPDDRSAGIDCEALFVALVIAPQSYARNRFPTLYSAASARRARRRAALVRSLVAVHSRGAVLEPPAGPTGASGLAGPPRSACSVSVARDGASRALRFLVRTHDRALGVERRTWLLPGELAVLLYVLERNAPDAALLHEPACQGLRGAASARVVEVALAELVAERRARHASSADEG